MKNTTVVHHKKGYMLRLILLVIFTVLSLCVVAIAGGRQQMPLVMYKLGMVTAAAVVGAWIDWCVFFYNRPCKKNYRTQQRMALIMCACIIAVGLGY